MTKENVIQIVAGLLKGAGGAVPIQSNQEIREFILNSRAGQSLLAQIPPAEREEFIKEFTEILKASHKEFNQLVTKNHERGALDHPENQ